MSAAIIIPDSADLIARALTSPSNLLQRELCPGSAFAEYGLPETDNEDSKEGTLMHLHDADPSQDRSPLKGEQLEVLESAAQADEEIFAAIKAKMSLSDDEEYIEGREERLWFKRGLKKLFPGHCDRWRFYPERRILIIIDKKFGRKEVTPANANRQLMGYGVAGYEKFDALHTFVAINQPRLFKGERITIGEYTEETIQSAKDHVIHIWEGAHNPDGSPRQDAPRIEGEEQCRYCKAKRDCDAYRAKYEWLEKPSLTGKDLFVGKIAQLSNDQLDSAYRATKFAALVESDLKEEIIRRIDSGEMTIYTKQNTGSTSAITNEDQAIVILEGLGFSRFEITELKATGKIAEVLARKQGITQDAAKKQIKEALAPVTVSVPKSPSLKRAKFALK